MSVSDAIEGMCFAGILTKGHTQTKPCPMGMCRLKVAASTLAPPSASSKTLTSNCDYERTPDLHCHPPHWPLRAWLAEARPEIECSWRRRAYRARGCNTYEGYYRRPRVAEQCTTHFASHNRHR